MEPVPVMVQLFFLILGLRAQLALDIFLSAIYLQQIRAGKGLGKSKKGGVAWMAKESKA